MSVSTAIYVRVSTEEQALHGFSIRAQKEKLIYYAKNIKNWDVYDTYIDDGISGKNIKERPEIKRMLEDIANKKVNNVLVFKIDRLTRSTKDLIDLIEFFNRNNCDFNSLNESIDTSSATGRMFIKIIGIFAEFERENIVERVKLGFERKVKEGNSICSSTPPFGYNRPKGSNILVINKSESVIVKRIYAFFLNGFSISKICNILNMQNIKTKKDRMWSNKTIKLILTNTTYIGKVRYGVNKKNYFDTFGHHIPIISESEFNLVQQKLLKQGSNRTKTDAYYSHILKCKCGSDMISKRIYKINKSGVKKVYINYRCKNKKDGCSKDISHKKIDKMMSLVNDDWIVFSNGEKYDFLIRKNIHLLVEKGKLKIIM